MHHVRTIAVLALGLAGGCGGDDGLDTALGGIYELTEWTRNEAGCAAEGASILAMESRSHLLVHPTRFFGPVLELTLCGSLDECREDATDDSLSFTELGTPDEGNDTMGWVGHYVIAGGSGTTCSGEVTETTLRGDGAMMVRIDSQRTPTGDFAPDAEGFCDTDAAQEAAAGMPCAELDVIRATLVESL